MAPSGEDDPLLIDGALTAGGGGRFATINPATEEPLGTAADGDAADMDRAIAAARVAFDESDWARDTGLRVHCIRQLRDALNAEIEMLRDITVAEVGAPIALTYGGQLQIPVDDLEFPARTAENYSWTTDLGAAAPLGIATRRTIVREPYGVVGAITPWNFPHQINLAKIGPAMAAGNTVVLKPAPDTPWCAAELGRIVAEKTDIPAGVLNIVTSSDHRVGAQLAGDPRVDLISFTGSTVTGSAVMTAAAQTVKKVFLELGGKSAFIVLDDADLQTACAKAAVAVARHAGQGCAFTSRLLVPRDRYDDAVAAAAVAMAQVVVGDPTDPTTVCGPVISARQRDRIAGYLRLAIDEGGVFACGGGRPAHLPSGFYIEPTVIGGLTNDARVALAHDGDADAHRERLAVRAVGHRVRHRPGAGWPGGLAASGRHRQRQRRDLVLGRYALRRLQAVGPRPRDGPCGIRGVPGDEGHRHGRRLVGEQPRAESAGRSRSGAKSRSVRSFDGQMDANRRSGTIGGGDMTMPTTELTTSLTPSANAEAVVDLSAIAHNVRVLREHAGSAQVMTVVKADGYGHGAPQVARAALAAGAAEIGVATIEEALALRREGITAPVLAWLHPPGTDFAPALQSDVQVAVSSPRQLHELLAAAKLTGVTANVTVKVDTGLSRNGVSAAEYPAMLTALRRALADEAVRLRGIMSHLVHGDDPDNPLNDLQSRRLTEMRNQARNQGVHFEIAHLSNSPAAMSRPDLAYDLVRPGIATYGLSPIPERGDMGLRPAMTLKCPVALVRSVRAGDGVSYGHTWIADRDTTLALLPVGYADGVFRGLSGRMNVLINGRLRPNVGRVCMDQFVVDLGPDASDVSEGDEAILFGPGTDGEPTAQDWADVLDTIHYEVVTSPRGRVVRTYLGTSAGDAAGER